MDFCELVTKASAQISINYVVGDKGYDSEANHRFVREQLSAVPIIPLKQQPGGIKHGAGIGGECGQSLMKAYTIGEAWQKPCSVWLKDYLVTGFRAAH